MRRHVFGHHRTRAHERVFSNGDPADNGGVGANGGSMFHQGPAKLVSTYNLGTRVPYVRENAGGPAKNAVLELDAVVDRNIVLDLDPIANRHVAHVHVLTEHALTTNFCLRG